MARPRRLVDRLRAPDPRLVDAGLALGLTGWMVAELPHLSEHTRPLPLLVMTIAIAFRRRWPLAVLAIVLAGVVLNAEGDGGQAEIAAIVIAAYSAALYSSRRWLVAGLVLATASVAAAIGGGLPVSSRAVPFLVLGPVWLAGAALRRRERRAEQWEDRVILLEREQAAALRAERARIARELHDVVTHGVSVMVLQTGAARQVLARDRERAEALLRSVEAGGREAMNELRTLLGLLSDDTTDAPLAPRPGLDQIEALVDRIRDAGMPVELTVDGTTRPLPPGIDLAAYRIVQEALTNALRHGKTGPVRLVIRYTETALELEVLDKAKPFLSLLGVMSAAVAAWSACVNGSRSTAAHCRHAQSPATAMPSARGCRWPGPSSPVSIRVLIADDDPLTRSALHTILTLDDEIKIVAEAADGDQAILEAARTRPDVILMDIRMPGIDGLEAARQILDAHRPRPRIIMLTTFDLDEYVYAALSARASGFLLKDTAPERLAAAVRLVADGDALLAPTITRRLVER